MTKKEALKASLFAFMITAPEALIDKAFIDADVNGNDNYTKSSKTELDTIEFELLKVLSNTPDITEGGFSIKHNREGIKTKLVYMAKSLGRESELQATEDTLISSASPW